MMRWLTTSIVALLPITTTTVAFAAPPPVKAIRVPNGGVQPQAMVDRDGGAHLIYLVCGEHDDDGGGAGAADIVYHRFPTAAVAKGEPGFGPPMPVNTHPGSGIATGTVRGPHLALGRDKSVHVAWMGSAKAEPKAPGNHAAMLYARLRANHPAFDRERNLVTNFVGLDGGGSIAADSRGNVYVAWHAPPLPRADESMRRVFLARSTDNGDTFAPEKPMTDDGVGVCACCGIKLITSGRGGVIGVFRTAREKVHRDARAFLYSRSWDDNEFQRRWESTLDPAESATCMMSTFALAESRSRRRFIAAWETPGRGVRVDTCSYWGLEGNDPRDVPGAERDAKHPSVAVDREGNVLVAWATGTGWARGGGVAWQMFDRDLEPIDDDAAHGKADGLPAWSRPAIIALPGKDDDESGGFVVLY